ncbi:MAG: response regulator [Pseudomonadota bacterium]
MKPPVDMGLVLIVDDVEVNRILARAYLEMLGWRVDDCEGGRQALEYLEGRTPEWVLLDIRMPGLDGIQLARIIRQSHPMGSMRLAAYTAHAITEEVDHIRSAGFDHVLIKPVSLDDMNAAIGSPEAPLEHSNAVAA